MVCGTTVIVLVPPALAAVATASTRSETAAAPFRLGSCFIDGQSPALEILAIEACHSLRRVFVLSHFDETKSPGLSGVAISHYFYLLDLSELREKCAQ